eukprot:430522-Prorocentrum_minimum.AAC.1
MLTLRDGDIPGARNAPCGRKAPSLRPSCFAHPRRHGGTLLDTLGHVWTYRDTFGHVGTRLDMLGHIVTRLDTL